MATLNEIAFNIKNLIYGGNTNVEQDVSTDQIKFWVHYYRAQILKENAANGKGLDLECLQEYRFTQDNDTYAQSITDWKTYIDQEAQNTVLTQAIVDDPLTEEDETADVVYADVNAITDTNSKLIVPSNRTFALAGISPGSQTLNEDYYGRAFRSYNQSRPDDFGILTLSIPTVLNISGKGVKNLKIKKAQSLTNQNHNYIDVPVLNKNEFENKRFNRFGSNNTSSYIQKSADDKNYLNIGWLQSTLKNRTNGYQEPIQYMVKADLLLSNPTEQPGWSDDNSYPFPQALIGDLNRRILSQELAVLGGSITDDIDDNAASAKLIQPKAQK